MEKKDYKEYSDERFSADDIRKNFQRTILVKIA